MVSAKHRHGGVEVIGKLAVGGDGTGDSLSRMGEDALAGGDGVSGNEGSGGEAGHGTGDGTVGVMEDGDGPGGVGIGVGTGEATGVGSWNSLKPHALEPELKELNRS